MIQSEERNDVTPVCPHCNEPLRTIQYRSLSGFLGKRYPKFTSHESKLLQQGGLRRQKSSSGTTSLRKPVRSVR